MERKPSIGRIVIFNPGTAAKNAELFPKSMSESAAIVTLVKDNGRINISIFLSDPTSPPMLQGWNVAHESEKNEDEPYWTWPEIK